MAASGSARANRPLSPHLQIWRWGPAMFVSILHRVSGVGLALGGGAVLLWWLGALVSGPDAYASFGNWMWADFAALTWGSFGEIVGSLVKIALRLVMIGISWAFFNHLCSGLRHFVLDVGAGYEVKANNRWSLISFAAGLLLTAAFWAALLLR